MDAYVIYALERFLPSVRKNRVRGGGGDNIILMTWWSPSGLRVRLLLLTLLAVLPTFGLIVYTAVDERRLEYQEIRERAIRQTGRFAAVQELRVAAVRHLVTGLAQLPAVHARDANSCTGLFQEILKKFPDLTGIVAATPKGEIFCSGVPFPRGTSLADRAYFQRALETRRFTVGEYATGLASGKPTVALAYPAVDRSGTVRAILVADLDLSWRPVDAAQTALAPGTVLSLIDRNGTILSRYPDHERWVGKSMQEFVEAVERNEHGREATDVDGIHRIYARTRFQPHGAEGAPAYVTLGIPTDIARLEVNRTLARNLIAYGIVAVLVFCVVWVGSDVFVLRGINTLLGAARRLGAGDLSARTGLRHGPGELEQLARAFDEMGERLEREMAEQRRTAEEIAAQRRFLRAVIDLNPNLIFAKDQRGRYTLANKAVADFYGATVEAIIGKTDADLNPNVEQVERRRRDDLEVLETGRDKFILEERITDATGQERWLQVVKRAIVPAGGTATHVLGVATDVTELKNLERQIFQTQKLEAIGQLAGGVAHDFNNLLTVILGRCALLVGRLSPDASPRRDIDLIQKTAERAVALTRQLLAFSRKQVLDPKVLDLNAVVPGMATMLQRLIGEHIELVYRPGAELGRVKADPGQLEQIIMNLAVNARDAMPDGGRITIETGNVELGEHYARQHVGVQPGRYVMLAVSDTGIGMDGATQARIFEPFFTTKAPGKGTGLGLSTVYGIVNQSGGNIWVYSEPGKGTTFKVYLPRVEDAAESLQVIRPAPGRGTESILLVEDEEEVRALAREVLQGYGYTVFEARDVAEALLIAERHTGPIHLLVTDVVMPQMSGRDLAERLASLRPEMKVLFMSGYTDNAIVHHGRLESGVSFVQKPFTPDALAEKVRDVLDAT